MTVVRSIVESSVGLGYAMQGRGSINPYDDSCIGMLSLHKLVGL